MMDKIFKKEIEGNLIIVYMDDVLYFSKGSRKSNKLDYKKHGNTLFFKAKKVQALHKYLPCIFQTAFICFLSMYFPADLYAPLLLIPYVVLIFAMSLTCFFLMTYMLSLVYNQ